VDLLAGTVIVVVEDERTVREALHGLFTQWGCKVIAASSCAEAAAALVNARCTPDAIVADYRLREHQTGADAIAELRRTFGRAIPALLVSGDTTPELFREARERSLLLLSKPVRAARLRAALLHLLVSSRAIA
jgi:CheY-like chemotaxis protein